MYILSVRIHFYTFFLESNLTMCPRGLNIIPFTLEILEAKMVNAVDRKGSKARAQRRLFYSGKSVQINMTYLLNVVDGV